MRTKKSLKNLSVAFLLQVITIAFSFLDRTIFIKFLGVEFLGINGLFGNVISMLSLAELGVGTAMVYSMYKPMASNDQVKISILMNLYAKIYKFIGIAVTLIGISFVPFLGMLIADSPDIPFLNLYFILFVLNSASSYFFVYKTSIFVVSQNEHIVNLNNIIFTIIKFLLQVLALIFTKKYLIYLLVSLVVNILKNLVISKKADKKYTYLKNKVEEKLSKEETEEITKNISALFFHRIGNVIVNGTDNLIISKVLGIAVVGVYSNYYLIIGAVNSFVNIIYGAITASIGNLNATESEEKKYVVYKNILFSNFWIGGICSICLVILLNPFINLWIGENYIIDFTIVVIIVINTYLTMIRKTNLMFRNTMGLFWKDRYKPIFESIVNLIASILLTYKLGLSGVFLGTIVSNLTTNLWVEPYILFKYGFKLNLIEYFKKFVFYSFVIIFSGVVTWYISNLFLWGRLVTFIYKIIVCAIVPNILFTIFYFRQKEFLYFLSIGLSYINKFK